MKGLIIRLVNVAVIVAAIFGYNSVVHAREAADEEARLEAESENARLLAEYEEKYGAKEDVSEDAEDASGYKDGTYSGSAEGFGGPVGVDVVISGGKITEINITSAENEDGAYLTMAEDIIPKIIEAQSAEVDTISGATFSSTGIKNATALALEGAAQ